MVKQTKYVLFSVDDAHPEQGWCNGRDEQSEYLNYLNEEFGAKFTLFVPANYHYKFPVSEHPDFFKYWNDRKDWAELASHGYSHLIAGTSRETEFDSLRETEEIKERFNKILYEWNLIGHRPVGFKTPGWLITRESLQWAEHYFQYVVSHPNHRHDNTINPLTEMFHIDLNDRVILHAHANNSKMARNANNINAENFQGWREQIVELKRLYDCKFMTFSEYHKEIYVENLR
jgi:hypothetical protein